MLPAYYIITITTMDLAFTFTDANDRPVCSGRCKARIEYFQYCPQRGHGKSGPDLHCCEARAIEELRNSGAISMISYDDNSTSYVPHICDVISEDEADNGSESDGHNNDLGLLPGLITSPVEASPVQHA